MLARGDSRPVALAQEGPGKISAVIFAKVATCITLFERLSETGKAMDDKADGVVAKANLSEHLKNIEVACDDARLSAVEKIRRIKEEIEKAQDCVTRLSL